jgi:hypothetical protein
MIRIEQCFVTSHPSLSTARLKTTEVRNYALERATCNRSVQIESCQIYQKTINFMNSVYMARTVVGLSRVMV